MQTIGQRVRTIIGDSFGADIVEERIEKAIQNIRDRAGEPQTMFYDPLTMFMGPEWMQRPQSALTTNDLRAMAKNPIIGSIIQTRLNQIAAFCTPRAQRYTLGFEITSDDNAAKKDNAKSLALRDWVYTMGTVGYGEATLESFARKFMRDSLELDQANAEIIARRNGQPSYVVAVDAGTVRRLKASLSFATDPDSDEPWYAQVVHERIVAEYSRKELIFGIRNPQTDIKMMGYGYSELELLVRTITTMLNADKFNASQLTQGGTAKGVMVVKGDVEDTQFQVFKRDFRQAIRNAAHVWNPPVLKISKDAQVDWKELDRSNRDMEYSQMFDFLVKQSCGVYQIDPTEINWQIGATGASVNFDSSGPEKQAVSKQRGLRPLLTFLANNINSNLIQRIDPRYRLEFLGLDEDRKVDSEITSAEVKTFRTVNDIRAQHNEPPLKGGDIILDPLYTARLDKIEAAEAADAQDQDPEAEVDATDDPDNRDVDITQELDS
jgi:hypothetical protein